MGLWIDKVGIEVECGVVSKDSVEGFDIHRDGSIESRRWETAEYVSKPFNYQNLFKNNSQGTSMERCVHRLYNLIRDMNDSMGLHIHVSLNREVDEQRIASMRFYEFFMNRLQNSDLWSNYQLRERADGVQYARELRKAEIDSHLSRGGSRYRHINYSALHRYGTIEFRIFPAMETPEEVMAAVEETTSAINKFLREGMYEDRHTNSLREEEVRNDPEPTVKTTRVGGNRKVKKEEKVKGVDKTVQPNHKDKNPLNQLQQRLSEVRNDV